jgi:D-alanyl-D-alanine carboxypeptidase (penicillin-binding protein 5/6)
MAYAAPYTAPLQPAYYPATQSTPAAQPAFYQPSLAAPAQFATNSAPLIRAASYILVDVASGVPMISHNADAQRGAASTQKIITALVVLDAGNLDKRVTVQASDIVVEPTRLGVRAGQTYTRRALLYAFLIKSANDVAQVLARDNAGSQAAFASKMNSKARALGMDSSYFANPHGLTTGGQHSTARDMARAALAAYQSPIIRDAVRQKYHTFSFADGRKTTLTNTNELLGRMSECNGMKTGFTNAAGRCLLSSASKNGHAVVLVQLGTKTKFIWEDAAKLMSWGLLRAGR